MKALYGGLSQRSTATDSTDSAAHNTSTRRQARASRPDHDLLRAMCRPPAPGAVRVASDGRYAATARTDFMITASTGTSSKPRLRPVSTAAILSITSMPSVTRANTA